MPPSLIKARSTLPPPGRTNGATPLPGGCPHAAADTVILNTSLNHAAAWCRRCGSLCQPFQDGVGHALWEAPALTQEQTCQTTPDAPDDGTIPELDFKAMCQAMNAVIHLLEEQISMRKSPYWTDERHGSMS